MVWVDGIHGVIFLRSKITFFRINKVKRVGCHLSENFVRNVFCQKCHLSEMSFVRKPKFYKKWYFFQIRYYIDIKLGLGLGQRQVRWRPGGLGAERPRVRVRVRFFDILLC